MTQVLKSLKDVTPEDRPKVGQLVNEAREIIEMRLEERKKEFDKNPQRYEELSEISQTAQRLEKDGKFKEASEIYEKLLEVSDLSHFVLVAQAGLYRCKK